MRTGSRADFRCSFKCCGRVAILLVPAVVISWLLFAGNNGDTRPAVGAGQGQESAITALPQPVPSLPAQMVSIQSPMLSSVSQEAAKGDQPGDDATTAPEPDDSSEHDELTLLAVLDLPTLLLPDLFNDRTLEVFQRMHIALDVNAEQLDRHFDQAQAYLSSQLDNPEDVAALMAFYRRYTEFELSQALEPAPLWQEAPQDADAAIALSQAQQEYRRTYFGADIADRVWGASLQEADYHQRLLALIRDEAYGDDTSVRVQLVQQLMDDQTEADAADLTRINPAMYIKLVRNGEALLAMPDAARDEIIRAYWRETREE